MIKNRLILVLLSFFNINCNEDLLSDYKWKNRILIVIDADKIGFDKTFIDQYKQDCLDRDLVLFIINDDKLYIDGEIASVKTFNYLNNRIKKISESSNLILVGKDGGVKETYKFNNDIKQVFKDIDAMPMRIREMRKRKDV